MTFCEWIKELNSKQYHWGWCSSNGIVHAIHYAKTLTTACNMVIVDVTGFKKYDDADLSVSRVCKNCQRITKNNNQ